MSRFEKPSRLLALSEVADLVNEVFDLPLEERIAEPTPYAWWDRSKKNQDISLPMPEPTLVAGGRALWTQEVLLHWFGAWRGHEVPVGLPAGDRVDSRGHRVFSRYRAVR